MKTQHTTRRSFLKASTGAILGAVAAPVIGPTSMFGAQNVAPNSRITVAGIGLGPQGLGVLNNFLGQKDVQVVAVCDVKKPQQQTAARQVNARYNTQDCVIYGDFREVLARKDVDVVLIATPDHWHVPVARAAVEAGKDVYLEKPMGLSIAEDQALRTAVHKRARMFQFGTQQRSEHRFRWACEMVRNQRIGKLKHINVWGPPSTPGGSTESKPVPPDIDYEFWLGPARYTPYAEDKCAYPDPNRKTWWFNYDYALGFIAGWGVHPLDIALWGAGDLIKGPVEITGSGTIPTSGACNTTVAWDIDFKFGSGVTMNYKHGGTPWQSRYRRTTSHGTAFEGTDGWVHVDREGINASPETLLDDKPDEYKIHLIRSGNHVRNLLDSVKSRQQTICPIDDAVQADVYCHLSDIVTRLNRKLVWDPAKEQFINDEEANRKLALRPVRAPWTM